MTVLELQLEEIEELTREAEARLYTADIQAGSMTVGRR